MIFFSKRAEVLKFIKNRTTISQICKDSGLPLLTVRGALYKFEAANIIRLELANKLKYHIFLTDKGEKIKYHIVQIIDLCK